jgi:hypothetical protein
MTTDINKLLRIPNLETVVLKSGLIMGAAHKHRLSVRDFAKQCEISPSDANTLIDTLIEGKVLERYVFKGENWVRSTIKKSNRNN